VAPGARRGVRAARGDRSDIDPNDIVQGNLGDCWVLASLAAIAAINPRVIRSMIQPLGPGRWRVRLFQHDPLYADSGPGLRRGQIYWRSAMQTPREHPWTTEITDSFPTDAVRGGDTAAGGGSELWVRIIERAYARMRGGYATISGGGVAGNPLASFTGYLCDLWGTAGNSPETAFRRLEQAWSYGRPQVCGTPPSFAAGHQRTVAAAHHAFAPHAYAVVGVNPRARTVDLHNPHGDNHLYGLDMATFLTLFQDVYATRQGLDTL
jgi:hypothetical protein